MRPKRESLASGFSNLELGGRGFDPHRPYQFSHSLQRTCDFRRQQKAAISNRIASASGSNSWHGWQAGESTSALRHWSLDFLGRMLPVGQGKTVANHAAISTPDRSRVSRASLSQLPSSIVALAKHPRSHVDDEYPPDNNQRADLQTEVAGFLIRLRIAANCNRLTQS